MCLGKASEKGDIWTSLSCYYNISVGSDQHLNSLQPTADHENGGRRRQEKNCAHPNSNFKLKQILFALI